MYDLVEVLKNMCKADGMATESAIQCVLAALRTLSGPGKELKFDDGPFLAYLYKILLRLTSSHGNKHVGIAMMCIQHAFLKRREHSMDRVAAFVKRLAIISLQFDRPEHIMATLAVMRSLFQRYPTTTQLLDPEDERKVCPEYLPKIHDPEHCNAFGATLEEVEILTKHAHPEVQKMAKDTLLRKEPLPHHQPRIILKDFDTSLSSSTAQVQGTLSNASPVCRNRKGGLLQHRIPTRGEEMKKKTKNEEKKMTIRRRGPLRDHKFIPQAELYLLLYCWCCIIYIYFILYNNK